MFPLFVEIVNELNRDKTFFDNRGRFCIVSNNIPGIVYIMRYARNNPDDDYSEIQIECFIVPGKPLSVYAAITGDEACDWVANIREILGKSKWRKKNTELVILGFLTGNYMCRSTMNQIPFSPAARGEGHMNFKKTLTSVSDQIFLLAPLMKFSFADVDLLNNVCGYVEEFDNNDDKNIDPKKIKYREVLIPNGKKCILITSKRNKANLFFDFSQSLLEILEEFQISNPYLLEIRCIEHDPRFSSTGELWDKPELEIELPHENLRSAYKEGKNIWDLKWVTKQKT
ncbi:MAG: hypothetical protein ABFD75_14040 [Smithella sp.]